jgi:GxxExxY protein
LIEKLYEEAMCHELNLRGLSFVRQCTVPFKYKGVLLSTDLRTDLVVAEKVVVDFKSKEDVNPIEKLRVLTYLRLLNLRLGLVINFHVPVLKDGVFRIVNNLIERPPTFDELPDLRG